MGTNKFFVWYIMLMAMAHRTYAGLDTSRGERHIAYSHGKKAHYDFFPAKGKRNTDRLIVISPGWLGTLTLNGVAQAVSDQGHDVALVHHLDGSWKDIFRPNRVRAQRVHAVTRDAVERTSKKQVHFIDHSNGNQDVVSALKFQMNKEDKELTYIIDQVTSVDGVGTNGKPIDPRFFYRELHNAEAYGGKRMPQSAKALGYSAANFVSNPILAIVEGAGTLGYDARPDMKKFEENGVKIVRAFHDKDWVIRPPDDTDGALIFSGGHLSAAIERDTLIEVAAS